MRTNTTARRLWINMSYAVLLLCLVLIGPSSPQFTTHPPLAEEVSVPQKDDKTTAIKPSFIKHDISTEDGHIEGEDDRTLDLDNAESRTRHIEDEDDRTPDLDNAESRTGDREGEDDRIPDSDSAESRTRTKFTFQPTDARAWSKSPDNNGEEIIEGDDPDKDSETKNMFLELEHLIDIEEQLMNNTANDSDTTVTKIVEEINDNDDEGESDDILSDENDEEQTADSKPEESQIKRQEELNPLNPNKVSSLDFDYNNRKGEITAHPTDVYVTVNDQPDNLNPENDNSPLLQLTQGGYKPPYGFNTETPRVRTQSASQQSEIVETPGNVNNEEQFRQPQISPQVSYADTFQPQFAFGSALGLRHHFMQPDSFVNPNGMAQPLQNPFFNAPPAGFTDFTGSNFQAPFTPSSDGGFQTFTRNLGGVSLFQAHNPDFMVQNQQIPQTQFLATDPTQATPAFYPTRGFMNYPAYENANAAPHSDDSPFLRNASPNNLQYQVNSNPFTPPRSPARIPYNLMMQFQPNFAASPQYSTQYTAPNQQVPVQSTAPEKKKQKDLEKIAEVETAKTEEQINTTPNKEDSSVPFGARIQKQNDPDPQTDFPPLANVYMRYPVKEAGYATEESLPVQNTTTKAETKSEPSPPRPIFRFFQAPGQFSDPYRNALNVVQQGLPVDSSVRNIDDSNRTKLARPEQFPPRAVYPFNQPALTQSIPGYPSSRNPNSPLIKPPAFFRNIDSPATDPYEQIALFPDQFPAPLQTDSQSQETLVLPACVQGQANASVCFEDPEYPKGDVLFALTSDPYLMDRFSMPDQPLDAMTIMEQDLLEHPESPTNYICSSITRYGYPLRAKNVNGQWKVIANLEKGVGQGRFMQPVRLEVCKGAGDPCNFVQVKTTCVQKYSIHQLLAWSAEMGIHNDVFKLPMSCSCQLLDSQA